MPVRNDITGIWRHLMLPNLTGYYTGIDTNKSYNGSAAPGTGLKPIKDLIYIVKNANFATQQDVSVQKMLQGTAKTRIVQIGNATDTLSITGPTLFAEGGSAPTGPVPLMSHNSDYADAGNIAAAFIYNATNVSEGTESHAYAKSVKFDIGDGGANWTIDLEGDPTSLMPDFSNANNNVIPFGYGAEGGVLTPLGTSLRVGAWYDFYVNSQITTYQDGTPNGNGHKVDVTAYVQKFSFNIAIGSSKINLMGRGQAPYFGINSMEMNGTMSIVFTLMNPAETPLPTWQAVPQPWGTAMGMRTWTDSSGNPSPPAIGTKWTPTPSSTTSLDWPDALTIDTISVVPKYVYTSEPLISAATFGPGFEPSSTNVIIKNSKVNIDEGIIHADMDYEVVFAN